MKTIQRLAVSTAVIALLLTACAAPPDQGGQQTITVKGSDTMVPLGQRWAEVYMKEHPDVAIQVTGGGSGTGIAALINGTTQICESSRPITADEKMKVKAQRNAEVVEVPVAIDALAVYLNKENNVTHLDMDQTRRIFQGQLANWKELGGKDAPIVLYGRENSSGTYVFFKEHVLQNADFAERYQGMSGTAAVINAVTKDPNGIGYGGIGYATDVKTIAIAKDAKSDPIEPNMANALSGTYPLARQLFWLSAGEPTGKMKELYDWVLGPEGQKLVTEVGYYPLKDPAANKESGNN
jgi:phosphate transport system substrate-binding protein